MVYGITHVILFYSLITFFIVFFMLKTNTINRFPVSGPVSSTYSADFYTFSAHKDELQNLPVFKGRSCVFHIFNGLFCCY